MSQQPDTYNILEIQCMHSSDSARLFVDRRDYDQLRAENERLKAELAEANRAYECQDEKINRLYDELVEAKKDAERYRYFCEHLDDTEQTNPLHIMMDSIGSRAPTKQELSEAIDAAMKGK